MCFIKRSRWMKTTSFQQTLQRIMNLSKSSLKIPKYMPSVDCQLTKMINLIFSFPILKERKSDVLRTYAQEKEKFSLDLRIYKEDWFSITVPLQKRMDVLIYGFKYYDTTMPKQETIDFTTIITTLKIFVLRRSIYPQNLSTK